MGSITVQNVGKAYKNYASRWHRLYEWLVPGQTRHQQHWVLRNIDLTIRSGESVGIIGVNGAGKSTLLKMITGTAQPTEGTIRTTGSIAALLELGMGFHPEFTGRQNVLMSGQLMGHDDAEIRRRMPEIEAFAAIGDYIDQPVKVYSSGMSVRLAFSVATAIRPEILIVDEALAVGDVFFQQKCFQRIREFRNAGTTLLFVTHAFDTVYALCDRAIWLDKGRIAADAAPRHVIDVFNAHQLKERDPQAHRFQIAAAEETPASPEPTEPIQPVPVPRTEALPDNPPAPDDRAAAGSFSKPGAQIESVRLLRNETETATVIADEELVIEARINFHQAYEDPHAGFQLRNAKGESVFMTNTYCMGRFPGKVAAGDVMRIRFRFPVRVAPGNYTITVGLAEGGAGRGEFRESLGRIQDVCALVVLENLDAIRWSGLCNLNPHAHISVRRASESDRS